jgi:hypothetical protein
VQGSNVSSETGTFLPLWVRIGMAALIFAVTVVSMWQHFLRLEWVGYLCFGLYYLTYVPRQKGEALGVYFTRPRSITTMALLFLALAGFGHNLVVALRAK